MSTNVAGRRNTPDRRWADEFARLQTRASRYRSQSQSSPLAQVTEDALSAGVAMVLELAQRHGECERLRTEVRSQTQARQHLFDVMPTPCLMTDEDGEILQANPAAGQLLNVSSGRLKGRLLSLFCEDRDAIRTALKDIRFGGAPVGFRLLVRPRERRPIAQSVLAAPAATPDSGLSVWFLTGPPGTEAERAEAAPAITADMRHLRLYGPGSERAIQMCSRCGQEVAGESHASEEDCIRGLREQIRSLQAVTVRQEREQPTGLRASGQTTSMQA